MEIEFNNVSFVKDYGKSFQSKIINNLNMKIDIGTICAICGEEDEYIGKLLCALCLPTTGNIKYKQFSISPNSYITNINGLRKEIGYVYDNPLNYFFNNTVEKEIEYGIKNHKYKVAEIKKRTMEALKILGLDDSYLAKDPHKLSLSEQKKVMIASTIAYNPNVFIFNNIERNLCKKDQNNLIRLLKILNKKYNKTIIIISNDLNFTLSFVKQYYFINDGSLLHSCSKEELLDYDMPLYMKPSPILEIVRLAKNKGSKIDNYYDINELIKGVYRDVR